MDLAGVCAGLGLGLGLCIFLSASVGLALGVVGVEGASLGDAAGFTTAARFEVEVLVGDGNGVVVFSALGPALALALAA